MATIYFIIDKNNIIQNSVMADSVELALLGTKDCIAVTELAPTHKWPVYPNLEE